jgi:hypothetical protein
MITHYYCEKRRWSEKVVVVVVVVFHDLFDWIPSSSRFRKLSSFFVLKGEQIANTPPFWVKKSVSYVTIPSTKYHLSS